MMKSRLQLKRVIGFGLACSLGFSIALSQAATINFVPPGGTFEPPGSENDSGNALVTPFTPDGTRAFASAWSITGGTFDRVTLQQINGFGLGVCNDAELGSNCLADDITHTVDNIGGNGPDFVLLEFTKAVQNVSAIITQFGPDSDISYFGGAGPPNLQGRSLADVSGPPNSFGGVNTNVNDQDMPTINLSALTDPVAWVLIGTPDGSGNNDRFKLKSVTFDFTTPIPLPPVAVLFGTGLVGLIGLARRKVKG